MCWNLELFSLQSSRLTGMRISKVLRVCLTSSTSWDLSTGMDTIIVFLEHVLTYPKTTRGNLPQWMGADSYSSNFDNCWKVPCALLSTVPSLETAWNLASYFRMTNWTTLSKSTEHHSPRKMKQRPLNKHNSRN